MSEIESVPCPNCGQLNPKGSTWCPNCGEGKMPFDDGRKKSYPFSWGLCLALVVLIPLVSCGGCLVANAATFAVNLSMLIMACSVIAGACLTLYNLIVGPHE